MSAELIAKLESAERGTFVLDAEIWCAVNGYEFVQWDGAGCVYRRKPGGSISHELHTAIKLYSVSIDAALALAERVLPGWQFVMATGQEDKGPPWVQPYPNPVDEDVYRDAVAATTLPLAICAALLRASAAEGAGQ